MKHKVIQFFVDLKDNNHAYNVGDAYPREGVKVTAERIAELSGKKNKQGKPLIAKADEKADKEADKEKADEKADK